MKPCWKKAERPRESERKIFANQPEKNAEFKYADNYISTSKYTFYNFLPKNLMEQFQRIANVYFLILLILQLIPWISSLSAVTTIVPLFTVLSLTAVKDIIDDIQRHRSDNKVNNRATFVLRHGKLVEERWHNIHVGDIIKMENDHFVAADLLVLSSSEPNSLCYIETAELDGETNLKVRQSLPETAVMGDDINQLGKFNGEIICEPPNNNLNKYEGLLRWRSETFSLDNDKMLLRGCVLRNTKWCYGVVVFAGKDTKLMKNTGVSVFKRTHIDRIVNVLIVGIFAFLMGTCVLATIACGFWNYTTGYTFQVFLPWDTFVPGNFQTNKGSKEAGATVVALLVFLSYVIVLNTLVPISLYVSIEFLRGFHSLWINWDIGMYHARSNTPAKARTTTLNEELGQIEYIFSDKTGTLTQNIMTFNKCSINGTVYGDAFDKRGHPIDITERTPKCSFAWNELASEKFDFYDQRLIDKARAKEKHVDEFFRLLALCHTVMAEEKEGKLEYQAQSPDEEALVSAAKNFGYAFKERTPNSITINMHGEDETYELLHILDFNNVRKRMSVIVKHQGEILLLCKGADTLIYERLAPSSDKMKEVTLHHLNDFAVIGLRTLCLAQKKIDPNTYKKWAKKYHECSTALDNREEKVHDCYETIEKDMTLLGATAIEDKLQKGVPEAIANLALANIKIWVLTGDKQETAINIGYSCQLLTEEMEEVFIVDGEEAGPVEEQLKKALDDMKKLEQRHKNEVTIETFSNGDLVEAGNKAHEFGGFALVINGHSLVHALKPDMEDLFLDAGTLCKAVICCRVTPLQKALVVDLVKRKKNTITLAIGDGANDVSMIKTAHIGVGISGQEGMQAVLASDFSLAQFRYLERLLLVHGRWSYLRMCKFMRYFFYKNFAFTLCHFWFGIFCGWSAQTLFDPIHISVYNLFYTSTPVIAMAVFDQDVSDEYSLRYPRLYTPGHLDLFFNKKVFCQSIGEGVITSIVLFFFTYGALYDGIKPDGLDLVDHQSFAFTIGSVLIVVVTLRCALDTTFWTWLNVTMVIFSIIFYFAFSFLVYADWLNYIFIGTARHCTSSAPFWFLLLLCIVVLLVPVVAERFYYKDTRPTLTDKVRLKQRIQKSMSKSGELVLRRQSTFRRSNRSIRSGYAFAHQEGFGSLITSGKNMRGKKGANSNARTSTSADPSHYPLTNPKGSPKAGTRGSTSADPPQYPNKKSPKSSPKAGDPSASGSADPQIVYKNTLKGPKASIQL